MSKIFTHLNTANQISNLLKTFSDMNQEEKAAKANDIVTNHVGFAASAGLIPIPGADLAAVTAVQLNMLRQLAKLYNVNFMEKLGKNVITAVAGTSIARVGASLIKIIPGIGTVIGELGMAAMSGASTYALGRVFASHFAKGGTLDDFDIRKSKKVYEEELNNAKDVAKDAVKGTDLSDDLVSKLKKLSELKEAGILTDEEFQTMKGKLISQM